MAELKDTRVNGSLVVDNQVSCKDLHIKHPGGGTPIQIKPIQVKVYGDTLYISDDGLDPVTRI